MPVSRGGYDPTMVPITLGRGALPLHKNKPQDLSIRTMKTFTTLCYNRHNSYHQSFQANYFVFLSTHVLANFLTVLLLFLGNNIKILFIKFQAYILVCFKVYHTYQTCILMLKLLCFYFCICQCYVYVQCISVMFCLISLFLVFIFNIKLVKQLLIAPVLIIVHYLKHILFHEQHQIMTQILTCL